MPSPIVLPIITAVAFESPNINTVTNWNTTLLILLAATVSVPSLPSIIEIIVDPVDHKNSLNNTGVQFVKKSLKIILSTFNKCEAFNNILFSNLIIKIKTILNSVILAITVAIAAPWTPNTGAPKLPKINI